MVKVFSLFIVACGLQMSASAQENSPYSRYGVGDLTPNHNIFSRSMGGIAAGIADNRSINFTNPASLSSIYNTIFDVGADINYRILKSSTPAKKFTSANTYVSYLQLAFPLTTPKMAKDSMSWSMSVGIKPVTNINYKIEKNERLAGIDSINSLFEGSGGVNQAFLGTGLKIKNFSMGINGGYMFGNKDYSTIVTFINDSTFYYTSNSATKTSFGGLYFNAGLQYDIALAKNASGLTTKNLRVGIYGNMQQSLNARQDQIREIIFYDQNGGFVRIDSVFENKDVKGTVKLPAMVGIGFSYQSLHWQYGADLEYGNWNSYRFYGQKDAVKSNFKIRVGGEYDPYVTGTPTSKYFKFVKYRAGLYYGTDYINVNRNRPEYGFTIGTGMPLTSIKQRNPYGDVVVLNTALEIGNRGNKQTNLRENVVRFNIGISMNNLLWFRKPKYN